MSHIRIAAVRRVGRLAVAAALVLALTGSVRAAAPSSLEYPIKATFLEKFGDYVTWPAASLAHAEDTFFICVYGQDPFGPVIDQAVRGHALGTHPIAVQRIATAAESDACRIVYFGPSATTNELLETFKGRPVLTVTDAAHWNGPAVGIIHFVLKDNHVRFVIDEDAAVASHLVISSKLLNVALSVNQRAKGAGP